MKRVLIKISGEAIAGTAGDKFDLGAVSVICHDIKAVVESGIGVSIVVGGGNIIRGRDYKDSTCLKRETADSIGMMATAINAMILRDAIKDIGIDTEIVSPLNLPFDILQSNPFVIEKLVAERKVIIFSGGLGTPYFSTDTMAIVASFLSKSDMLLKSTKTDGIYDKDPAIHSDATHIPHLTYKEAIRKNLKIMDQMAFALAEQRNLPIHVFSIKEENCFIKSIKKEIKQSIVSAG
jgi:uridylate kinase